MQRHHASLPAARWLILALMCALVLPPTAGAAAVAPTPPSADATRTPADALLARENGYAELVQAGELLRTSKRFSETDSTQSPGATLSLKRAALLERPVVKALALLREGLARQVFTLPEDQSSSTHFSDLAGFRNLGRLLKQQQYVHLADGRVGDALEDARLGLRLARVIQTNGLLFGLTGIAISSLDIHSLGQHLEQLSAPDCDRLYQISVEWLDQPNPVRSVLESERRMAKQRLRAYAGPEAAALTGASAGGSEMDPGLAADLRALRSRSPAAYAALLAQAEQQVDAFFDQEIASVAKPLQSAPAVAAAEPESSTHRSLADRLAAAVMPSSELLNAVIGNYQREEAEMRLMACHSAILRYRWEHDQLPPSLTVLKLGELAIDPFSGKPLQYVPHGRTYRLASIGTPAAADDPRAVGGRRPISIAPGE